MGYETDRERLAEVMARAAAGDSAAATELYEEFGLAIARSIRRHLDDLGMRNIPADELHGLTIDACLVLFDHAKGWRPDGGALPWVWAARRLRNLASSHIGQWSVEFDEGRHDAAAPPCFGGADDEPDELDLLRTLARERPDVANYADALGRAATSERNQQILLAYRVQISEGDPSPAHTIGNRFGLTPAAVRQVVKRTSDRLSVALKTAA